MTPRIRFVLFLASAALLAPLTAGAQPLPPLPPGVIFHAPPPLVELEAGVQVVPGSDHEVFFFDGRYYLRHDGRWYRSRGHRWHWRHIDVALVPHAVLRLSHAPGHYRHYRAEARLRVADRPGVVFHARPELVEIEPGIMVVPDSEHEVFYVNDRFYLRHHGHWYRSRGNRWHWRLIDVALVPLGLRNLPGAHGHYRHYRPHRHGHEGGHHGDRPGHLHRADDPGRLHNADGRRERREDRRDERMDRREDRRDDRRDERMDRREDRRDDRRDERMDRREDRRDDRRDDRKDKRKDRRDDRRDD